MLELAYHMPVKILWGNEIVNKEYELLKPLGLKAAIITGKTSALSSGALTDVLNACSKNGQLTRIYNTVMSDPPVQNVVEIASEINHYKPDFLIAIGGGSVIDAAKVVALLLKNGIDEDTIWKAPKKRAVTLVAVPTTAGTGSEVTPYAVLTDTVLQTKKSVSSEAIYPHIAFLDPRYTESLPVNVTINTAIDALSHLIEGFFALRANTMSDIFAIQGMSIFSAALPSLLKNQYSVRDRNIFMAASLFGGLTIAKSGTTLVHALGYSLTYFHKLEHGKANGLLLSAYLDYMNKAAPEKTSQIIDSLGLGKLSDLQEILKSLYPIKLNLTTREIALYVEKALKTSNVANTPGEINGFVLADILQRSVN